MKLRHIRSGYIIKDCYINNYNNMIEIEVFDRDLCDYKVIDRFKTLKEFLDNYEEY